MYDQQRLLECDSHRSIRILFFVASRRLPEECLQSNGEGVLVLPLRFRVVAQCMVWQVGVDQDMVIGPRNFYHHTVILVLQGTQVFKPYGGGHRTGKWIFPTRRGHLSFEVAREHNDRSLLPGSPAGCNGGSIERNLKPRDIL